jgi:hypothetical protein
MTHLQGVKGGLAAGLVLELQVGHQELEVLVQARLSQRVVQQEHQQNRAALRANRRRLHQKITSQSHRQPAFTFLKRPGHVHCPCTDADCAKEMRG